VDPTIFDEVHFFWFGDLSPNRFPTEKFPVWFEGPPEFDAEIRERYATTIDRVDQEGVEIATLSPRQKVGLVVLLDQFPRNIHRSSGAAFEHDHEGRVAARAALKHGFLTYHPAEQLFIALPFQHSEETADQDLAVFLAAQSAMAAGPDVVEAMRRALDFATKHRDLIRRFGRFPHRNMMIGRETTPEEAAFIKEHGRGY
jgi:uncharacterized protein (DUF924 family)